MPITMKELAYMAGVSRATVDRVLNERGRVNIETEQRIRALAESMDYQPNIAAKSLAIRHKNYKIGFIVNREGNAFFEDVIAGANAAAEELRTFGIKVLIRSVHGLSAEQQLALIDEMTAAQVGAIAITPINDPQVAQKLNQVTQAGIPVVAVTAAIDGVKCLAYVGCHHEKSGRIAAELAALMTGSSANVGVVVGSLRMLGHKQRLEGFRSFLAEKHPAIKICCVAENEDDNILSYNRVLQMLQQHPQLDLLFFASAGVHGGLRAVMDANLGGAIKVITFDLTQENQAYLQNGVVSAVLCQEPYRQGYTSIKLLSDYLMTGATPKSNHIFMQTEIMVSQSL